MNQIHVVTGAGPVGTTVALQLADQGHTRSAAHPVRQRPGAPARSSGGGSTPPGPSSWRPRSSEPRAVYHCIHGSKYAASTWRAELPAAEQAVLDAAGTVGAVVVFPESLYAYGPVDGPITEDLPRAATGGKLGRAGRPAAGTGRVVDADRQRRRLGLLRAARPHRPRGRADGPHDPGRRDDRGWSPASTTALLHLRARPGGGDDPCCRHPGAVELRPARADRTGRDPACSWSSVRRRRPPCRGPRWARSRRGRSGRPASSREQSRELAETAYMFTEPFVLDSSRSEERLGLSPTPLDVGAKATVDWWRAQRLSSGGGR